LRLKLWLFFGFWILSLGFCSFASAKEYDGIWFLGLNQTRPLLKDFRVRKAIGLAIDRFYIAGEIVSAEVVPASFVPPGMLGYDPDLKPDQHNLAAAKKLLHQAGYSPNNRNLKHLTLLHTDGLKTIAIAQQIQGNLLELGLQIDLVQISFFDQAKWNEALASQKYDLFLMGYKANIDALFSTEEASTPIIDSYDLLEPLFKTRGEANFTSYSSIKVDHLFSQLSGLNPALKEERHKKLKEINRELYKDRPAVLLFYIEKL
jgi:ABC-type transport system substrate-binding protein